MTELRNIFNSISPQGLAFSHQEELSKKDGGIAFLSRGSSNNGIAGYVKRIEGVDPIKGGKITVAMSGSVMEAFFHDYDFYTPYHLIALEPKEKMIKREVFFYISVLRKYKELYNYGRQANKTIMDLLVPKRENIPSWVYEIELPDYSDLHESYSDEEVELPDTSKWGEFTFDELFKMSRGRGGSAKNAKDNPGENNYLGASAKNNGVTIKTSLAPTEKGNSITIATNGSVGASFYQKEDYLATTDVTSLYIKERELNPYIAMFIITLTEKIASSFDYGRKWGITRMKETKISLPVTPEGKPDWDLMERYIKSLPYSKYLE